MIKVKLLNCIKGVGRDTGKPWCKLTLASTKADGTRVVSDFWCNQTIASKAAFIPLDSQVYISAEIDESLHFAISDIRSADVVKSNN